MPINSRRKGHNFERLIAAELRDNFPQARRGLQSRDGGAAPDVAGVPGIWIECKRSRRPNIPAAIRQAQAASAPRCVLIAAVTKADGEEPLVTMPWRDWKELLLRTSAGGQP